MVACNVCDYTDDSTSHTSAQSTCSMPHTTTRISRHGYMFWMSAQESLIVVFGNCGCVVLRIGLCCFLSCCVVVLLCAGMVSLFGCAIHS